MTCNFFYLMKSLSSFLLAVVFSSISLQAAAEQQYLKTTYSDGVFVTVCQTEVNASETQTNAVISRMIDEFHTTPVKLFDWALKNLGMQGQKNNEMIVVLKSSKFDKKTGITHGLVDVEVPNLQNFQNVRIDALVKKENQSNGQLKASADVLQSGFLLKKAIGTVTSVPQHNGRQLLQTVTHIKFGWFLNLFISQKRYQSIVEWRVQEFTKNLKKEAEKATIITTN